MQKPASSMIAGHRLHSTLFAVALFHGLLVLGVTFAPEKDSGEGIPTLEVVMLIDPDENQENSDRAEYVAQTSQLGSGTTEDKVHPTSGQLQPFAAEGNADGNDLQDTEAEQAPSLEPILAARARQDPSVQVDPAENLEPADQQRVAMQMTRSDSQALAELERATNPQITGETKREMFVAVNTSQSDVAEYLARWKQKIERMGTLNFPTAARTTVLSGNPTLEVALRADGSLEEIIILRSSGHKELDLAAMRILRLAAPFDPFPQEFRAHYDVLRFVYEWQFLDGKIETGSLQVTDRQPPP
ncbi:MAG: TonB family protein [Gammaproteobacteria bacterium]|nr:TonB family protein [Gammaproteobacteria bacterium]